MTSLIQELITKQQHFLKNNIFEPTLLGSLDRKFALFFLKIIEELALCPPSVPAYEIFLENYLSLFGGSLFCVCSRPTAQETQAVIALAQYCAEQTQRPITDFLFPGVSLTKTQQEAPLPDLLRNHFLSSCHKQLKTPADLFVSSYENLPYFTNSELAHLKNHSRQTRLFFKIGRLQNTPERAFVFFLGEIEELLLALSQPMSAKEVVSAFEYYYNKGLSNTLRGMLPPDFHLKMQDLFEYVSQPGRNQQGLPLLIIPPELSESLITSYDDNERKLFKLRETFEKYPYSVDYHHCLEQIVLAIVTNSQENTRHGFLTLRILEQINASLTFNYLGDVRILEHIPAEDLSMILKQTTDKNNSSQIVTEILSHLKPYQFINTISLLETEQALAFLTASSPEQLAEMIGFFEAFPPILCSFKDQAAYYDILEKKLAPAIPTLLENSFKRSQEQQHVRSRENFLHTLLKSYPSNHVVCLFLKKAITEHTTFLKNKSFFHVLITSPKIAITTDDWLALFKRRPDSITDYLPNLPVHSQSKLIIRVAQLINQNQLTINLDILLICLQQALSLKNLPASHLLMTFSIRNDFNQICCHLCAHTSSEDFVSKFTQVLYHICEAKIEAIARFLKSALSLPQTRALLLCNDIFPEIIALIQQEYPHTGLLQLLFDELYHEALCNPDVTISVAVLKLWLLHDKSCHYQAFLSLPLSFLQRLTLNSCEGLLLLELLLKHRIRTNDIPPLYAQMTKNNFSSLFMQLSQETSSQRLDRLKRWSTFIALYDPGNYLAFFQSVIMPTIKEAHELFITQPKEIIYDFLSSMPPSEQKTFILALAESESFSKMSPDMVASIFEFCLQHLKIPTQFNLAAQMTHLSSEQRSSCYNKITAFDLDRDKAFLFTISDIFSYWQYFEQKHYAFDLEYYRIFDYFGDPKNITPFISSSKDWLEWFSKIPESYQQQALAYLLTDRPSDIFPILNSSEVRKVFSQLPHNTIVQTLSSSFFHKTTIIKALIRLDCDKEVFKKITEQLPEQKSFRLTGSIHTLMYELRYSSEEVQYDWLIFLLKTHLHELSKALIHKPFQHMIFKNALSNHLTQELLTTLLEQATGHESLLLSAVIRLGLCQKILGSFICSLPTETYLQVWKNIDHDIPQESDTLFEVLHSDLTTEQIQSLLWAIAVYDLSNNRSEYYENIFSKIVSLCPLSESSSALIRYFNDKQEVFLILNSSMISQYVKDKIKEKLLSRNGNWLRSFNITTSDLSEHCCVFSQEEFIEALSYVPVAPTPKTFFLSNNDRDPHNALLSHKNAPKEGLWLKKISL